MAFPMAEMIVFVWKYAGSGPSESIQVSETGNFTGCTVQLTIHSKKPSDLQHMRLQLCER